MFFYAKHEITTHKTALGKNRKRKWSDCSVKKHKLFDERYSQRL